MATGESKKRSRNIFATANKYQEKIILLSFFPSILTFLTFIGIVFIGNPIISQEVYHTSFSGMIKMINQFSWLMIFLMCLFLFVSTVVSFIVSHKMLGAVGRIIHELDEVIAGRSQKTITSRPKDDMTNELLKRINVLAKFYIENKGGK